MKRLTIKEGNTIFVKEEYGEKVRKTGFCCFGEHPTSNYSNCDSGYCGMEKLYNYEELEDQGFLIKLPCTIGQTVYEVQNLRKRIQSLEITSIIFHDLSYPYFCWKLKDDSGVYQNIKGFSITEIGETVFLTKEEAEEKLIEIMIF